MAKSGNTAAKKWTIGALSKRTGCNIETIRYYEKIGLLPSPPRSEGGHRVYDENHLKRLAFIRRTRELGFTLNQVRELLGLVDGGDYGCGDVQEITLGHLGDVRRKISDLKRLERVLKNMAAECPGGTVPECPIIDVLYAETP